MSGSGIRRTYLAPNCVPKDTVSFEVSERIEGSGRPMVQRGTRCASRGVKKGEPMKKVLIALVATLVAVSVAGCAGIGKGKGKAPPPIVTKG